MSVQRGAARAGMSGIFSFPHLGETGILFTLEILIWKVQQEGQIRPRRGRGATNFFAQHRYFATGGGGVATGIERGDGFPCPTDWEGAEGTVRIDFNVSKGQYATYPIKVTSFGHLFDVNRDDQPKETLGFVFTGIPTFYGWPGTQPTAATVSKTDQAQWVGSSKTIDPKGLQSAAVRLIDVWGAMANTDIAEQNKLAGIVSAAVPPLTVPHSAKLRTSTYARDAIDGGTITETWGLTDTAEDWINPQTRTIIDPGKIQTGGSVAAINATPAVPSISGQTTIERKTTSTEINDSNLGKVTEFGQRTTVDDIEMEETQARIDKSGMESEGQDTNVYTGTVPGDAASPHSSLQAWATSIGEINRDSNKKVTFFRVNKPAEQWVYDRTRAISDPSSIKNLTLLGAIFTTGSEPSAPGANGLVLKDKTLFTVTSPNTSNLSGVLWTYAETTSADDEIFPRTKYDTDPYVLTSAAITGAIVTTSAALGSPTAPSIPAHLVLSHWQDSPLTDPSASNKSIRLYFWELRTSQDTVEMDGTTAKVDEMGIDSEGQDTQVYDIGNTPTDADSPDASLKAVAFRTQELNRTRAKYITYFDVSSSTEKWVFARTRTLADASAIKNLTIKGATYTRSGGAPSAPGASGLVLNHTETFDITSSDTSDLQGILWFYGETTSADDEVFPRSKTITDAQNIKSEKISGEIVATAAVLSAPGAPTGLKYTDYIDIPLTNASASNKSLRLYHWSKLDSLDEITLPKFRTKTDGTASTPLYLDDEAVRWKEWLTSATPPTAPDDLPSNNVKLLDYTDLKIYPVIGGTAGLMLRVFVYGARDSRDKLILPNYETTTDAGAVTGDAVRAYLDGDSVPSTPSGLVLRDTKVRPVTLSLGTNRTLTVLIFGIRTHTQDVEMEGTVYQVDQSSNVVGGSARVTVVEADSTPDGGISVPGLNLRDVEKKQINPGKWAMTYVFGQNTHETDVLFEGTEYYNDPSNIEDHAQVTLINSSQTTYPAGLDTPPTVTLKLIGVMTKPLTSGSGLYAHRGLYGLVTSQQKIEQAESDATTTPLEPSARTVAAIVTNTNTLISIAAGQLATYQTDSTWMGSTASRKGLPPNKAMVVDKFLDENLRMMGGSCHTVREAVRGIPTTAVDSNLVPQPEAISLTTSLAFILINFNFGALIAKPLFIWRTYGGFFIERVYSADNLFSLPSGNPPGAPFFLAIRGHICDGSFLGYSTGQVQYSGPVASYCLNPSVAASRRRLLVRYAFQTDDWKFFNDGNLPSGSTAVNSGIVLASGLYWSSQFEAGYGVTFPRLASFSGFLTPQT